MAAAPQTLCPRRFTQRDFVHEQKLTHRLFERLLEFGPCAAERVAHRASASLKSRKMWCSLFLVIASASSAIPTPLWGQSASAQTREPLRLARAIPLRDLQGQIDHLSVDVKGHRLFLAALEKNTIEVVDLKAGTVEGISRFQKPQGVLYLDSIGRLFVASGKDGTVKTFAVTRSPSLIPSGLRSARTRSATIRGRRNLRGLGRQRRQFGTR